MTLRLPPPPPTRDAHADQISPRRPPPPADDARRRAMAIENQILDSGCLQGQVGIVAQEVLDSRAIKAPVGLRPKEAAAWLKIDLLERPEAGSFERAMLDTTRPRRLSPAPAVMAAL